MITNGWSELTLSDEVCEGFRAQSVWSVVFCSCFFLAVLTPQVAVMLSYITDVSCTYWNTTSTMLSLSSSSVFSLLGLVAFLLRSPILLFAVAQIIKWNYCVCTNPMFFSFLSQFSWRKNRKLRKCFERMQRVRKKKDMTWTAYFFFIVSIVYLFSGKSVFCGFHEPLFPEEQHPVPWRKGRREGKKPRHIKTRQMCADSEKGTGY